MVEPDAPRIVRIERQPRRRVWELHLDDGRAFTFGAEACERARVAPGISATEELLRKLETSDRRIGLHEAALRLLTYRPRSEAELRQRLAMRGAEPEAVDEELARLRAAGLLDDARFAAMWVEERARSSPRSGRLLRQELRAKGISAEPAVAATSAVDDAAAALEIARKRARSLSTDDYRTFEAKLGGFLQRRGFDYTTAREAIRTVWAERADGPPGRI